MHSPTQYLGTQRQSPYFHIALYAAGNVLAVGILLLVWFSWGILAAFQEPLLWAWLCSLSLRDVKRFLVSTARRELTSSSFIVCCAKLVFLPAVIAWQLFEEVRDKLQAKYHELQVNSQAGSKGDAAATAAPEGAAQAQAGADTDAPDSSVGALNGHSCPPADDAAELADGHAAGTAVSTEGAQQPPSKLKGSPVIRQRKASSKQQQQQQQHTHQRPPLGPRSNGTAAAVGAAAHKQGAQTTAKVKPAAAGAAGNRANTGRLGRKQATACGRGTSLLQQRLLRVQDFFKQLFSGYGFIIMELLRFVLGGLLPRRASATDHQQQRQHQQQQRQQQQAWAPVGSSSNSTLAALGSVQPSQVLAGLPPYLDLQCSVNTLQSSAADSVAESSYPGSCRSECNMPWTPHPYLHQLYLQQQQQQQQQQQPRQNRLSSSSSSPSLHTAAAASRQPSPQGPSSSNSAGYCSAANGVVAAAAAAAGLDRHLSVPAAAGAVGASGYSLSGWAGLQSQQQQQHRQGQALSRCDSNASCAASQTVSSAAARSVLPSRDVSDSISCHISSAPFQSQQQQMLLPPGAPYSLPNTMLASVGGVALPGHAASLGGPFALPPDPLLMQQGPGAYEGSSGCWEGVGPGRSPPGSVSGVAGGNSPSAVLFKGLLRGIVLYEGYRFVRGFLAAEQSLFMPLLLLGATLAVAGGLPFLLLPASLLRSSASSSGSSKLDTAQQNGVAAAAGRRRMRSPFSDAANGKSSTAAAGTTSSSSCLVGLWRCAQDRCALVWSRVVSVLVRADSALRAACASSFLDTAVSGLIVVGLILGSVVLSAVLLVQIGDESRQAVVSVNTLVRQKGTEAGLTEGVWSLVQQYEGQLVGMTQYVLQETLPGLTHYVETRASDFLVSHNLSRVLIDWEVVRAALKLPADCGEEAKLRQAVQLANSSLAEAELGRQRQQLQQQLDAQQQRLSLLAAELERVFVNGSGSSSSSGDAAGSSSSGGKGVGNSSALAQEVVHVQGLVERLHEQLHSAVLGHEAASEQLKLAELRMHNCQPSGGERAAAAAAAGLAGSAHGRGLLSNLLGGFTASKEAAAGGTGSGAKTGGDGGVGNAGHGMANALSHVRGVLTAVGRFDFATAGSEITAMLGQLMPDEEQQQQQSAANLQQQEHEGLRQLRQEQGVADHSCGLLEGVALSAGADQQPLLLQQQSGDAGSNQCPTNNTCIAGCGLIDESANTSSSAVALAGVKQGSGKGTSSSSGGNSGGSSSSSTSLVRVARGAAYPLITLLRHVSSVLVAGLGSTTAVALGTGLGVLRLGLGVAKFIVQLGVFASVLYTLLALDIDPVEQLVKLLPISEASQDRASRAVTKALRGVFVSSLKLAAFHAGFTWLTLRAFGTHFVCTATVASAIVAVLPLVPVYLTALPAVLELVLVRGAAVKGLVLLALHVGAYTFGDDLIYREIEPTLPYLVGLGVFGGMYNFANPLQGVLLGPMVLALLSVGYNLHLEMY